MSVNDILQFNDKNELMVVDNQASESILLIGSCRITPFLNYLMEDPLFGTKFNYCCVLVYNPSMITLSEHLHAIQAQTSRCTMLIAEFCQSYNYFNTSRACDQNIFQVCQFSKDIILPNWDNICLYAKDLIKYRGVPFNEMLAGTISLDEFTQSLQKAHDDELARYVALLHKAGWADFIPFMESSVKTSRVAYTLNHPTNFVFLEMYRHVKRRICSRDDVPETVLQINATDFLKHPGIDTLLTYYDTALVQIDEPYLSQAESNDYITPLL